jgi:mobilome CxxCx(11)CxxC protein
VDPAKIGKNELRDRALQAYAAAYIFETRATLLGRQLKIVIIAAVAIAVLEGLLGFIPSLSGLAVVLGIILAALCALAVVLKWNERQTAATEARGANLALVDLYEKMAKAALPAEQMPIPADLLDFQYQAQLGRNNKLRVTEEEKHLGLCAALRHFRWPCPGCSKVPMKMVASDCPECGKFRLRKFLL